MAKVYCPQCCGNGGIVVLRKFNEGSDSEYSSWVEAWCEDCTGTGLITRPKTKAKQQKETN